MYPNRDLELDLTSRYGIAVGMDEVGRGALAGPVCVGACAVSHVMPTPPAGIRDSKLLRPRVRENLVDPIKNWAVAWGVGWTDPAVIDQVGLTEALRLAGIDALRQVRSQLSDARGVGAIILDGKHNWLGASCDVQADVFTQVKADVQCVVVAAASVLAKVARDNYMAQIEDPGYSWANNKGYASSDHREAIMRLGPSDHHRKSWKLPKKAGDEHGC